MQTQTSSAAQRNYQWLAPTAVDSNVSGLERIGVLPIYSVDSLVRRSQALQATNEVANNSVIVNAALAKQQGLSEDGTVKIVQNGNTITMPVVVDNGVADNSVLVAVAINETTALADGYGSVEITTI